MPIAWHVRSLNKTFLVASVSDGDFPNVGPDIEHLEHDCSRVVFNSTFNTSVESFANHQWLQSVRVFPNGTAFGLIHNEFHGFQQAPEFCQLPRTEYGNHCNLWSTGVGISTDGGQTFRLAAEPPHHRVFSQPYPYIANQSVYGFGAISEMMQGADGAWYGLVYAAGRGEQLRGMCPFRSTDLGNPGSFKGWDGAGYTVTFADPYSNPPPNPGEHVCTVVPGSTEWHSSHPQPRRLALTEDEERLLRAGAPLEGEPGGGGGGGGQRAGSRSAGSAGAAPPGPAYVTTGDYSGVHAEIEFRFSAAPDFAHAVTNWSQAIQVFDTGLTRELNVGRGLIYPTLLDARSPELGRDSYDIATNKSTLLLVNVARNIFARRVVFTSSPPPPPPPPLPPAPANCTSFEVRGAGEPDVDGTYFMTKQTADGVPVFSKDATRQLYREQGIWRLAQMTVLVYYEPSSEVPVGSVRPPPEDWRISRGMRPAPATVICASTEPV